MSFRHHRHTGIDNMMRFLTFVVLVGLLASEAAADSIFDSHGLGRDLIPATGSTRALGGATLATEDKTSSSLLSPFAAAYADRIIVTGGFAHISTNSTYLNGQEQTITTTFPSLSIVIPFKGVSILTGLFEEKLANLKLTATDTTYSHEIYTVKQTRQSSIHSVPILLSAKLGKGLVVSGGPIFSFFDIRTETSTDFASGDLKDTQDIYDMSADGSTLGIGLLAASDRFRFAIFLRTGANLEGEMECENRYAGIYSTRHFKLSSSKSISMGLKGKPVPWLAVEVDYHQSPWSEARLDTLPITASALERWAVGITYTGPHLGIASRYPLLAGYYRQPVDWHDPGDRIYEQTFSIGTIVPIGKDRASLSLSIEVGRREDSDASLKEKFVGFSCSISAKEVWRREVKR